MLAYRVFPYRPEAGEGEPGHPSYVHPDQGAGRWDNSDLYRLWYLTTSPEAAVGEVFAHLTTWSSAMLGFPQISGAERHLGTYRLDEEALPLLDLDDARALLDRGVRPTDVVVRNRPRTQGVARRVHAEGRWAGVRWWSMHRPQWTLLAVWAPEVELVTVEPLPGHPGLLEAASRLAKLLSADLR